MIFAGYLVSIVYRMGERGVLVEFWRGNILQNTVGEIGKEVVPGSSCLCPLQVISGVMNH
jgi:hypothetical protein